MLPFWIFRHFGFVWETESRGRQGTGAVQGNGEYGDRQSFELNYEFILNSVCIITCSSLPGTVSHEL